MSWGESVGILRVFVLWYSYGTSLFDQHVTYLYDLGKRFGEMLSETPDFELPTVPQSNIVCFRYVPNSAMSSEALNELNRRIRQSIIEKGDFYIVQTQLNGKIYLRVTLISPYTTEVHLQDLLMDIRKIVD